MGCALKKVLIVIEDQRRRTNLILFKMQVLFIVLRYFKRRNFQLFVWKIFFNESCDTFQGLI